MKNKNQPLITLMVMLLSLGVCVSAYAEYDGDVSVTDNGSTLEELSAQTGNAPTQEGAESTTKWADIPAEAGETEVPIENGSGMVGIDVQITKGGDYIESVTVKNGSLVVKVRSPGTLTEDQEYSVNVTLYDMETGKSSKFTIAGVIKAASSSSEPDHSSKPDNNSKPDNSSKPDDSSSSSQPGQITRIGLKDAIDGVVTANLYKYGGDDEAEFPILIPESAGTIRLKEKDIVEGRDVIRKVSVSGKKLVVEAKFPYNMLEEPEDYEIEVTLEDSKSRETATFTVKGSVYWQDNDAPVSPSEYREKKYVVVDFEDNDGDTIHFENGRIQTGKLSSGVANLDISYSGSNADCDGLDLYFVRFLANPRLDRSVTVCLDADEGNCVYEIGSGGRLTKIDATYNKPSGELRFETRRLGEYAVTEEELDGHDNKGNSSSHSSSESSKPSNTNTSSAGSKDSNNSSSSGQVKPIPNTGRYDTRPAFQAEGC